MEYPKDVKFWNVIPMEYLDPFKKQLENAFNSKLERNHLYNKTL